MRQTRSWTMAFLGFLVLACVRPTLAAESCNQIEISPGDDGTVSLLLPDVANDLQLQLTARDARASKPADPWGPCPTAAPYGACSPAAHGDIATVTLQKILDPDDGKQLIGFAMKNGAKAVTRDVRLCVRYGME